MKTKKQFLWMLLAILVCGFTAVTMASCGDDGDDDPVRPNNPQESSGGTDQKSSQDDTSSSDMLKTPLTLEAIDSGTITFRNYAAGPVTYRVNGGDAKTIQSTIKEEITVVPGDKVAFYGDNAVYGNLLKAKGDASHFGGKANYYVYGNIMSLVSSTNFATATKLEGGGAFAALFEKNSHVRNHPSKKLMLPATTLAINCYNYMFCGCTGLTEAPALPATTLLKNCYEGMFAGCTNLKSITCLATDISADDCTTNWLVGVSSTGTFTKAKGVEWPTGTGGIPEGWTVVEK